MLHRSEPSLIASYSPLPRRAASQRGNAKLAAKIGDAIKAYDAAAAVREEKAKIVGKLLVEARKRHCTPKAFGKLAREPSPTIDQAINGGYPWLEIKCSRCQTPRDVDLAPLRHVPTTFVHDLAGRPVCQKCKKAGKAPARYAAPACAAFAP